MKCIVLEQYCQYVLKRRRKKKKKKLVHFLLRGILIVIIIIMDIRIRIKNKERKGNVVKLCNK
jgi:predicted nucleic acid-binding Zn ribbon protein